MKKESLLLVLWAAVGTVCAQVPMDTTKVIDLEEVIVVSSPKENTKLRQTPTAVSLISAQDMQANRVLSLKGVSSLSPNFFMPDYGSHLTSAVYIRGVGSRINTPAVGMYVDNIPYIDKSAFDFNFFDVERIDILRGPQGTLYGRNTMAGLVKVHTRNPFHYQGTDLKLGYATKDNHRNIALTHYHRVSDKFAFSGGGYYEGSDGFFQNVTIGKKNDEMESLGARFRGIWNASDALKIDFTLSYDHSNEGGYPYFYVQEEQIVNNRSSSYKRNMLNAGMNLSYQAPGFVLNATTGYQHLNDRMFLDQDFIAADIYTLEQDQNLNTVTEEITIRSKENKKWDWLFGVSGFLQGLRTYGPVTFQSEGVKWMQNTINGYMPDLSNMGMSMGVTINDPQIVTGGLFHTPVTNLAAFHQSTIHLSDKWSATIGLRLDYEHTQMDYDAGSSMNFDFSMTSARMPINLKDLCADALFNGKIKRNYVQLLPKVALKYDIDAQNNLYATVSKGYRSGGYNVQMFSDLLQGSLRNNMMTGIKNGTNSYLDRLAGMGMPAQVINMIKGYMEKMPVTTDPSVEETVIFKPEYTWNYEIGTHLSTANKRLQMDLAAFLMDTRDQQLAKFSENGLGRIMVNAGQSQSYGIELSGRAVANQHWDFNFNYGYTHATFKAYDLGTDDLKGNYVPFVPMHTLNLGANYKVYLPRGYFQSLNFGVNAIGAGPIYWTEYNKDYAQHSEGMGSYGKQDFYGLLNANVTLESKSIQLIFWGRNLTDTHYNTFAFESMSRIFEQHGKPLQLGVDVRLHF